jgi:protein SCO1/2
MSMNGWRTGVLSAIAVSVLAISGAPQDAASSELPRDSYYQLDVTLEPHAAGLLRLADLQGSPVIVAMFYASCAHVCPMTISTIKAIEAELAAEDRDRLRVLMVTLDPERDTPAVLAELADRHRVNNDRWRFARTSPEDVRLIAAVLGVKYRELPDGGFNHSSPILLLDTTGRELSRSEKLGLPEAAFVREVAAVIQNQVGLPIPGRVP